MSEKKYQELIPGRIFVGGANDIEDLLEKENIDVIYDLRAELKDGLPSEISVHQPIVDEKENQDESLKAAADAVRNAYQSGKNVYFHCNTGRGRAGTIAAATLLELGLAESVDEAEEKAKAIRPQIKIRPEFKEALIRLYEKK